MEKKTLKPEPEITLPSSAPIKPSDIFLEVIGVHNIHGKWTGMPHEAFKRLANSSKGDAGEEFLKRYLTLLGFDVEKDSRLGDWDLKIEGKTFEVKTATEDITGSFQFNHIRYDSKYNFLICLGVTPTNLVFDMWTKADVATNIAGNLVSMGKNQNSSFKLTKKVSLLKDIDELKYELNKILGTAI